MTFRLVPLTDLIHAVSLSTVISKTLRIPLVSSLARPLLAAGGPRPTLTATLAPSGSPIPACRGRICGGGLRVRGLGPTTAAAELAVYKSQCCLSIYPAVA